MMKFLQTYLGRSRTAHDLYYATANEKETDLIIISEPNKKIFKKMGYIVNDEHNVVVQVLNKTVGIIKTATGRNYVK